MNRPSMMNNLPRNHGKPWSWNDVATLCERYTHGWSVEELASYYGRSVRSITIMLERHPNLPTIAPVETKARSCGLVINGKDYSKKFKLLEDFITARIALTAGV